MLGGQAEATAAPLYVSGIASIVLGLYCFTLPHTPPARGVGEQNAAFAALREVSRQPLATLFLIAIPVSCIHQFYFVYTSEFLSKYGRDTANSINRIFAACCSSFGLNPMPRTNGLSTGLNGFTAR